MQKPRYRLAVDAALSQNTSVSLRNNAAHYLTTVLRLGVGDDIALFNRTDGEWRGRIVEVRKKEVVLVAEELLRSQRPLSARGDTTNAAASFHLTVCFSPIKGGRMETIIEKTTELGAHVLQPVITSRTIVDKVNLERAESIAREAAEQCERIDWPEIREPVKLMKLLGEWPADVPLIYGDESGESGGVPQLVIPALRRDPSSVSQQMDPGVASQTGMTAWAILVGPEGGFTPEEFAALARVKAARGVGLGPRILRADTAVITLCVATLMAWGDWAERPRFVAGGEKR